MLSIFSFTRNAQNCRWIEWTCSRLLIFFSVAFNLSSEMKNVPLWSISWNDFFIWIWNHIKHWFNLHCCSINGKRRNTFSYFNSGELNQIRRRWNKTIFSHASDSTHLCSKCSFDCWVVPTLSCAHLSIVIYSFITELLLFRPPTRSLFVPIWCSIFPSPFHSFSVASLMLFSILIFSNFMIISAFNSIAIGSQQNR